MFNLGMVLLCMGACFYIGILYRNPLILLLGDTLGILMFVSLLELLLCWFRVSCGLEIPIAMAEEKQPVTVYLKIKNQLFFSVRKAAVRVRIKSRMGTKEKRQWVFLYDNSSGVTQHAYKIVPKGAGYHEIYIDRIRIYAMSGLFFITKKPNTFASVLIMPEIHSIPIKISEAVRNFSGDAEVFDDFRSGYDAEETFAIREYREKDRIQSIHWKRSAKEEKLMVRESSQPKACAIVLLFDESTSKVTEVGKKKGILHGISRKSEDAYLQAAASLSFSLMDKQCPHFAAWYSREKEEIQRIRVDDEESFYIFLDAYMRDRTYYNKDIREQYREKYKSEWYLHDICINEQLEIYKDREFVVKLNETKIADACEQFELLL